jgi:hypothetical protein
MAQKRKKAKKQDRLAEGRPGARRPKKPRKLKRPVKQRKMQTKGSRAKKRRKQSWKAFSPEAIAQLWDKVRKPEWECICLYCVNLAWPQRLYRWHVQTPGEKPPLPVCVHHVDSPGAPREVHPGGTCPNFRGKPKPAVRGQPPEPPPGIKYIPLTRRLWATVDEADFDRLNKHHWYASPSGGGKMYARRNTKKGTILMHREVIHAPAGKAVDHKNRQTLDNRADNLRPCLAAQNEYNKGPRGKRSQYKGVYPDGDKWYAIIKHKGITYYLGTFESEIAAAKARDRKAYELEGEFAYLNFPEDFRPKGSRESKAKRNSGGSP